MARQVLIVGGSDGGDDLVKTLNGVLEGLLRTDDLQLAYSGETTNDDGQQIFRWRELQDGTLEVKLTIDEEVPIRFVVASGKDREVGAVVRSLQAGVALLDVKALKKAAQECERDPGALMRLGLGLNRAPDDESLRIITDHLQSADLEQRYNAAMGASFLRNKALAESLRQAGEVEEDEGVSHVMNWAAGLCGGD